MATIKEREIITTQPYCSNCYEDITQPLTKVIDPETLKIIRKICPYCSDVITNAEIKITQETKSDST